MLRAIAITLTLTTVCTFAQTLEEKCSDPVYHQLDFLLGDWIAYDVHGNKKAHHTIQRLDRTCVIHDGWRSSSSTGDGYFYFEPEDSTWHYIWIDNNGISIDYSGQLDGNELLLVGKPQDENTANWYILSISYLPNQEISVTRSSKKSGGASILKESHIYRRLSN